MKQELIQFREQIIYILWQTHKSELTMRDLASIFDMSLGNIHRIIKKWRDRTITLDDVVDVIKVVKQLNGNNYD